MAPPSHLAIALQMREHSCRIVWTTNFDKTVEDAAAKIYGSTNDLVVADLGDSKKIAGALDAKRFLIYGKLHGDYHSVELKNTDDELREQDAEMRRALVRACKTNGLDALQEALDGGRGFPNGLFWFKRSGEAQIEAVTKLIDGAPGLGVDAHIIDNETFDELLSDLMRFLPETANKLGGSVPLKAPGANVPSIRTNALPIISQPVMCKLIDCDIGGWKDIQAAIERAGVDIVARRIKDGVIAFGRDPQIRSAFESFNIERFETRAISDKSLTFESEERRLIRDALMRALSDRPDIMIFRWGWNVFAFPHPQTVKPDHFRNGSINPVDRLSGMVGNTGIRWTECCELRLDYELDRLWLLMDPRIHRCIPEGATAEQVEESKGFVRSRLAGRFNPKANAMLSGWARLLLGSDRTITLRSFRHFRRHRCDLRVTSAARKASVSSRLSGLLKCLSCEHGAGRPPGECGVAC
jgi:hypothetical protein